MHFIIPCNYNAIMVKLSKRGQLNLYNLHTLELR